MRGRLPKLTDFPSIRNQRNDKQSSSTSELLLPPNPASSSAVQVVPAASTSQNKRTSDRNRRSPSFYGSDNSSSDSTIAYSPKRPLRARDVQNFQPTPATFVETVQNIAPQQPEEINNSPVIGEVSQPYPSVLPLSDKQTPTLEDDVMSMTDFEAENLKMVE